jgi:hypothetical protein
MSQSNTKHFCSMCGRSGDRLFWLSFAWFSRLLGKCRDNTFNWGTLWRSWFMHWATSRKVAGLIPEWVTGILQCLKSFGRTMDLGSTQLVTEMITSGISWGLRWPVRTAYILATFICILSRNFVRFKILKPERPVQACNGDVYLYLSDSGRDSSLHTIL